jgi:integrase
VVPNLGLSGVSSTVCAVEPVLNVEQSDYILRVREGTKGRLYWDAQWRYRTSSRAAWTHRKQRIGLAWQERDEAGGWRKRRGRCPEGWLDEHAATLAATAAMREHVLELQREAERLYREANRKPTVREIAREWLTWLEEVKGAKPSTIADYGFLLREPGTPHKRGPGVSPGRIMNAFGDRPAQEVTTREVSVFLRELDREGLTPRNVNKHREVLSSIFTYACRDDTLSLPKNPVEGTDQRREPPPAALDYYEVEEVEALARACEQGKQRSQTTLLDPDEIAARAAEDRQDAEACRLLFYTGLRLGEVLALRWSDVDLADRLLLVRRAVSHGQETLPKGRRHRFVPLSTPAAQTLSRLGTRGEFTAADDYVLCNRYGRRIDGSALRRRYKRAAEAAGLRPVKLHGLRHAAGSLVARTSDPVFVRDFLGHAKLTTTNRYLSAKLRPEEFERLDRAFGVITSNETEQNGMRSETTA